MEKYVKSNLLALNYSFTCRRPLLEHYKKNNLLSQNLLIHRWVHAELSLLSHVEVVLTLRWGTLSEQPLFITQHILTFYKIFPKKNTELSLTSSRMTGIFLLLTNSDSQALQWHEKNSYRPQFLRVSMKSAVDQLLHKYLVQDIFTNNLGCAMEHLKGFVHLLILQLFLGCFVM